MLGLVRKRAATNPRELPACFRGPPRTAIGSRDGSPILAGQLVHQSIDSVSGEAMNRHGEDFVVPFRAGRFFTIGHRWYVATRGDEDLGPFPSRERARMALAQYLASRVVSRLDDHKAPPVIGSEVSRAMLSEFSYFLEREKAIGRMAAVAWVQTRLTQLDAQSMPPDEKRERLAALNLILEQL